MEVGQLGVVGHQVLHGVVDLVPGLNDHVVDVHVGSDAVWLIERRVNEGLGLVPLEGRLLSGCSLLSLGPQKVLLFLGEVDDLDARHLQLYVRLQALDVLDGLDELGLVISGQPDVHGLLVGLVLDELVQGSIRSLHLVQLLGDSLSTELHSVSLEGVDDVEVVVLLELKELLGLGGVAAHHSAASGVWSVHWRLARIDLPSSEPGGLRQLLEERGGSRLPTWLVLASGLPELPKIVLVAGVLLQSHRSVGSLLLEVLVLLEELILVLLEPSGLGRGGLQLLLLQVVLLRHRLMLALDRVELLDLRLRFGEPAFEGLDGDLQDFSLSLVLQIGVDLLLQLEVQLVDFVLECLRVLDVCPDPLRNLHPWCESALESIDVENVVNPGDGGLAVLLLVALLNVLD